MDENPARLDVRQTTGSSTGNPRKRGAGPGSASPELLPRGQAAAHHHSKARHTKALSSGQAIDKDPDFQRERSCAEPPGPQRRLFNHKSDDIASANSPRRQRVQGVSHRGQHQYPSKAQNNQATKTVPYESVKDNSFRPQRPPDLGGAGPPQILQPKPNNITESTHPVVSERQHDSKSHITRVDERDDHEEPDDSEPDTSMLRQPETRPISHDQLVVEVKGIYAGLVMVEAKCIDVDEKQTVCVQEKDMSLKKPLTTDQWRSLIALHKQLLHEHHDFFLASQHPSASLNLSKLAAKYSMPARMWRHGIHAFLEVLRHRLPESLEHMLAFIYIAYSMMALLYETVPTFEDTWIECLGDLGRYRMAIEDDEPKDREVWSGVAKYWYSKASDKSPAVGRLYHHLAILARPYTLEQLSLYTRSLTCVNPFESARGSIMTLLNPILAERSSAYYRAPLMEILGIKAHAVLFTYPQSSLDGFRLALKQLKESVIDSFVLDFEHNAHKLKRVGAYFAMSNNAAMLEYGALTEKGRPRSVLRQAFEVAKLKKAEENAQKQDTSSNDTVMRNADDTAASFETLGRPAPFSVPLTPGEAEISSVILSHASDLTFSTLSVAIDERYWETKYSTHLAPLVHVMMVFVWSNAVAENALQYFEQYVPWAAMCLYLNNLAGQPGLTTVNVFKEDFPKPTEGFGRPLWEDFILRGLLYTLWYFPERWFSDAGIDDEERQLEIASMDSARMERILWLGHRIASVSASNELQMEFTNDAKLSKWICYDTQSRSFHVTKDNDRLSNATKSEPCVGQDPTAVRSDALDSVMPDALTPNNPPSEVSLALFEAPVTSTMSSPPTTVAGLTSEAAEAQDNPARPKLAAAEVLDHDDVPMIDISPGKRQQVEPKPETSTANLVSSPRQKGRFPDPGNSPPTAASTFLPDEESKHEKPAKSDNT